MKKIGFVLPFYNESEVLEIFHAQLLAAVETRTDFAYEFIYVNDGSTDNSFEKALKLREKDPRVTVLSLSRNFGHELAITAGLDLAHKVSFDAVVIMDTDLQDPPDEAMKMLSRWETGVEVIYGQRRKRSTESKAARSAALGFYWLIGKLSETDIPANTSDFRVIDRKVVDEVVKYRERDRFIRGIIADVGFTQEAHLFDRADRAAGSSHYNFGSLFKLAKTAIFAFSTWPLKAITRLGAVVSMLSVLYGFFAIWQKFFAPNFILPGWTFMLAAILFLGGMQMLMLGLIGHYVGRIYQEVLDRPLYSVTNLSRTGKDSEK